MISLIQILLSVSLIILVSIFFIKIKGHRIIKVFVFLLGSTGVFIVFLPETTNIVANAIGVGRGADLIAYFSFINIAILYLIQFIKNRELKESITDLAREISIQNAVHIKPKHYHKKEI